MAQRLSRDEKAVRQICRILATLPEESRQPIVRFLDDCYVQHPHDSAAHIHASKILALSLCRFDPMPVPEPK